MGCTFCTSGTGEKCDGPLSTDEVEASCGCQCHECDACGSAYWRVGRRPRLHSCRDARGVGWPSSEHRRRLAAREDAGVVLQARRTPQLISTQPMLPPPWPQQWWSKRWYCRDDEIECDSASVGRCAQCAGQDGDEGEAEAVSNRRQVAARGSEPRAAELKTCARSGLARAKVLRPDVDMGKWS